MHPRPVASQASIDATARRLLGNADSQGGYRTVIAGETTAVDAREEAADLAGALSAAGKQVVLVDWSLDGRRASADALGLEPTPGLMDLLDGRASFEDVIRRLPDGDAHVVPCGSVARGPERSRPRPHQSGARRIGRSLRPHRRDRRAMQPFAICSWPSRAASMPASSSPTASRRAPAGEAARGTFLGFQVTDIDVVRLDRPRTPQRGRKMQLARSESAPEARF